MLNLCRGGDSVLNLCRGGDSVLNLCRGGDSVLNLCRGGDSVLNLCRGGDSVLNLCRGGDHCSAGKIIFNHTLHFTLLSQPPSVLFITEGNNFQIYLFNFLAHNKYIYIYIYIVIFFFFSTPRKG